MICEISPGHRLAESYLYVDIFRKHDLFSQRFLRLYFMRVCVGPSQIWRIPVEPLVHTCVTRYMRSVANERVCTHRACYMNRQEHIWTNFLSEINKCTFGHFLIFFHPNNASFRRNVAYNFAEARLLSMSLIY